MSLRVSVAAALVSFALLLVILELVRRRRIGERYAVLWLITGSVMLALSLWREGVDTLAAAVGIHYPPSALFVLASLFMLVLLVHLTSVVSRLSDENTALAQRLALLETDRTSPRNGRLPREQVDAEGDESWIRASAVDQLHAPSGHAERGRRAARHDR